MSNRNPKTNEPVNSGRVSSDSPVIGDAHGSIEQSRGPVRLETAGGLPLARGPEEDSNPWCGESWVENAEGDAGCRQSRTGTDDADLESDQRTLLRLGANGF
jgi:hypothetical protein